MVDGTPIAFGDPVYYTDSEAIDDADDAVPNTVKGTVDSIIISLSKGKTGPGGLKKTVNVVRRLYPT